MVIENAIGGGGNDSLIGNAGNNVLEGGLGFDVYTGNGGSDTFAGSSNELADDVVTDLALQDVIRIDDASFAHFGFRFDGQTLSFDADTSLGTVYNSVTLGSVSDGYFGAAADPGDGVDLRYLPAALGLDLVGESGVSTGAPRFADAFDTSVSIDGSTVVFVGQQTFGSENYEVYVEDEATGNVTLVSQTSEGVAADSAFEASVSGDGTVVAFESGTTNFVAGTNGDPEVYVRNMQTGVITLVSQTQNGVVADGNSNSPSISADATVVAFNSRATNLFGGSNGNYEVYLKDLASGELRLVSASSDGTIANAGSFGAFVSADGMAVAFDSQATNLVAGVTAGYNEVYLKTVATGAVELVSRTEDDNIANADSRGASVSSDGLSVAFVSSATNLVAGVTSGLQQVYVKNLRTGAVTMVSQTMSGVISDGISYGASISPDGRYVVFSTAADNLHPGTGGGSEQVFVKDLQTGYLTLLSQNATGVAGDAGSFAGSGGYAISGDNRTAVFGSAADNLLFFDSNGGGNVFSSTGWSAPVLTYNAVHVGSKGADGTNLSFVSSVSDAVPVQSVQLLDGSTPLSQGTPSGDAWTIAVTLAAVSHDIAIKAMDAAGKTETRAVSDVGSVIFTTSRTSVVFESGTIADAATVDAGGFSNDVLQVRGGDINLANLVFANWESSDRLELYAATDRSTRLRGGGVASRLFGGAMADVLYGGNAADTLDGGGGADIMKGGAGNDTYVVDTEADKVVEAVGAGVDTVIASASFTLGVGQEIERLQTRDVDGTTAVKLTGNSFSNTIYGNAGRDMLDGGSGADILRGGAGNDTYEVDNAGDRVVEAVNGGVDRVLARVSYALTSGQEIEYLATVNEAGRGALDLTGNTAANRITGNAGNNVIDGGAEADVLVGLGGRDTFAFTSALGPANIDTVTDFLAGTDRIKLKHAVFAKTGAIGTLATSAFATGSAAITSDQHIIYNANTGALFYDADGSGRTVQIQFAKLTAHLNLTHNSFLIA